MLRCTIGVVANTTDEEYLKRFFTDTLYRHIQYVSSYGQGIDSLRNYTISYLLMDHSMARFYLTRDAFKLIRISDDHFGTFGLSLGFSKFDTDLKNNLTNILLSYVDKGKEKLIEICVEYLKEKFRYYSTSS
jgi:ABC-type amino acid transport substrate-binding protein